MGRPHEGQIEFRLLCPTLTAVSLKDNNNLNHITKETSCSLNIDVAVFPSAKERLIHVTGSTSLDRTLHFDNCDIPVSAAQECLFRVYEQVLDQAGGLRKCTCRLLVGPGISGGVMGKGGKRIKKIGKETGVFVKVWCARVPCAAPTDELIQMRGSSEAVKKALLLVSRCIQKKTLKVMGVTQKTVSSAAEIQSNIGRDVIRVSFRLLCPCSTASRIIGPNAMRVKALEQETRTSIVFVPLRDGCDERVVIVSASENMKSENSRVQHALARIFNKMFLSEGTDTVTARLLIMPNQSNWLGSGEKSILQAIQNATGATLQVVDLDCSPLGASAYAKILQIHGYRPNVQVALFEVSSKLRERAFETALPRNNSAFLPHKLLNGASDCNEIGPLTDDMNSCRVSEEFPGEQWLTSSVSSRDLPTVCGDSGFGSGSKSASVSVTKSKLVIAVGEDVFGAVHGDKDSNLAPLTQISGATVEVHDPCPGSEGKDITSGTRDETMAAQSLLQSISHYICKILSSLNDRLSAVCTDIGFL